MIAFIFYFSMVWFFPWEGFKLFPSISSVYLFDLSFVVIIALSFKLRTKLYFSYTKNSLLSFVIVLLLAFICLFSIDSFGLKMPFKYVDDLVLQLLILAPIIEELIYRYILIGLLEKKSMSSRNIIFTSGLLFSFSHVIALFYLPREYFGFIVVQLAYTFILGLIIAKDKMANKSILNSIALHFVFNLSFYLYISSKTA